MILPDLINQEYIIDCILVLIADRPENCIFDIIFRNWELRPLHALQAVRVYASRWFSWQSTGSADRSRSGGRWCWI